MTRRPSVPSPRLQVPGAPPGAAGAAMRLALAAAALCLVATGLLTWLAARSATTSEEHLLHLQVAQAGKVLQLAVLALAHPLFAAAESAKSSTDPKAAFEDALGAKVGPHATYVAAGLWALGPRGAHEVASLGAPTKLAASGQQRAFVRRAEQAQTLATIGLLRGRAPRLGYGAVTVGDGTNYLAYAEQALHPHRPTAVRAGSPFSDLDYALYLGRRARPSELIAASRRHLPLTGDVATITVPFGSSSITMAARARGALAGTDTAALPWAVGIFGVLLAIVAAFIVDRLVRRRLQAEWLALEIASRYGQQRTIAETLQQALLPRNVDASPLDGVQVATRYVPGVDGVDVGGDWYDVIARGDDRLLLVVGDVSGRGLEAATVMASLRYAVRAYAARGDAPEDILTSLSDLLSVEADGYFATALIIEADLAAHHGRVVSAGHLPPLLVDQHGARFLEVRTGVPIGVLRQAGYPVTSVPLDPGTTVIAYTDGLVERRGEHLDTGFERLRQAAARHGAGAPDALVSALLGELGEDGADDTAILAVRWPT
ncbi:MAG: PP2C family protein-serine/threonine phosphatase [Actinomycetota bacterium]|nr:PP2C family protein-serine/threonine phosphatase [Actinomycetota bacterium]